jgi:hypothetical protein
MDKKASPERKFGGCARTRVADTVRVSARIGRGPGLVISPSGISIRQGLSLVSNLAWSEATTVEIKSTPLYSCLVIGMRNADRLIDNASGYRQWALRSNLQRFGSPFLVSTSALKCDRNQLFQTVAAYRAPVMSFGPRPVPPDPSKIARCVSVMAMTSSHRL